MSEEETKQIYVFLGFFDGLDSRNECKARLDRRLTGFSGLLYSHSKYGQEPYNTSRNCVLMLVAPIGYSIRVRAIHFDVASTENARNCEKDTLHVFDVSRKNNTDKVG